MIILKKILNSCRYNNRLLIMIALLVIGGIGLILEGRIYWRNRQQIEQLQFQIQRQQNATQTKGTKAKAGARGGLKFDGIFQDRAGLFAVFNGSLFKVGDRIDGKYEVQELNPYKVSVKNMINGETTVFTLINPAAIKKSQ